MKRHIAAGALFVASILLGWLLYRAGGTNWLLIYVVAGGPVLMAAMWALDQRRRQKDDQAS